MEFAASSTPGYFSSPLLLGAFALLLAQLLLDRRSDVDISPFAFTRFAEGSLVREKNVI